MTALFKTSTSWINLATKLPPSVETIKLTDTDAPLLYDEAADLAHILEKLIKEKESVSQSSAVSASWTWNPNSVIQIGRQGEPDQLLPTSPNARSLKVEIPYQCDNERRQAGSHCRYADLRWLAARQGVEIHTNRVERCIGPWNTLFCHVREPKMTRE
jgi:hypothetical protein